MTKLNFRLLSLVHPVRLWSTIVHRQTPSTALYWQQSPSSLMKVSLPPSSPFIFFKRFLINLVLDILRIPNENLPCYVVWLLPLRMFHFIIYVVLVAGSLRVHKSIFPLVIQSGLLILMNLRRLLFRNILQHT